MMYATVKLNWKDYILPAEEVLKIYEILSRAERYEKRYPKEQGEAPTHHAWQDSGEGLPAFDLMSKQFYLSAKLAGEPIKS